MHRIHANYLLYMLDRIGMYVHRERDLDAVITLVNGYFSGMGLDHDFGYDFREWLFEHGFDERNCLYWGTLVELMLKDVSDEAEKIVRLRHLLASFFETSFVSSGIDTLSTEHVQRIDTILLTRITSRFKKAARVVGETLKELENDAHFTLSDLDCLERLHVLIAGDLVESQGNIFNMRFSEIRLKE